MNSAQIKEADLKYIIHTYGRFDVVVDHAKGSKIWDKDGKEYIDFTTGIGVNSLGYCNEGWTKAVKDQVDRFQHISNLFYHEPGVELAKKIIERTGLSKVMFSNSGAEANEAALKLARKYGNTVGKKNIDGSNRSAIISLEHSFHGRTFATVTATARPEAQECFVPLPTGYYHCEVGNVEELKALTEQYGAIAVIMELVQGEGGVNALDKDFAKAAYDFCKESDIIFIVDEVQSGMGRTGSLFAFQQYEIMPDIVSFAKGMGGGLPIGGIITGPKVCDIYVPGDHGSTFAMNPIVCAGANFMIDTMTDEFLDEVKEKATYLRSKIEEIDEVEKTTGLGMMIGVVLKKKNFKEMIPKIIEEGLLVLAAADKIRLLPPLNISYEDMDAAVAILKKVLDK